MTNLAVRTRGLTKYYGAQRGIDDLTVEAARGEVFGLVGPNGAGKTTTIRLLMGLLHPTSGDLDVLGATTPRELVRARERIGYVPGDLALYPNLTGKALLAYFARMRGGVPSPTIAGLAERLELDLGRHVHDLSRGNRQKLGIAQAFMHDPDLLILDEPTSGLDPLMQQEVATMVRESADRGACVLLSSHVLSEVEHLADRVAVVLGGRLERVDAVDALTDIESHHVLLRFPRPVDASELAGVRGVEEVRSEGDSLSCVVRGPMTDLLTAAVERGVVSVLSREPDLEEVFLTIVAGGEANDHPTGRRAVARDVA